MYRIQIMLWWVDAFLAFASIVSDLCEVCAKVFTLFSKIAHRLQWSKHMSRDEVDDIVRPSEAARRVVVDWLVGGGATNVTVALGGDWVFGHTTVKQAEALFGTT
jgi:hypothetical protein